MYQRASHRTFRAARRGHRWRAIRCVLAVVATLAVTTVSPASAETISFAFAATLDTVDPLALSLLGEAFRPGQVITGRVAVVATGPDLAPFDDSVGIYHAAGQMRFGSNAIGVQNLDVFNFNGEAVSFFAQDSFNGPPRQYFGPYAVLSFFSPPPGTLASDTLEEALEALPGWPQGFFAVYVTDNARDEEIRLLSGPARSLDPAPVPEPSTLLLIATGGVAIVNRVRKRRRARPGLVDADRSDLAGTPQRRGAAASVHCWH
jgi:PEP-CTERM motif